MMTKLEEIEHAISKLKPEEMAEFRRWFEEFDARVWDEKIEKDASSGRLDSLIKDALDDHKHGRTKEI